MSAPSDRLSSSEFSKAEQEILSQLGEGNEIKLGGGSLPGLDAGDERIVEPEFIRGLLLGEIDGYALPAKGLRISGALIAKKLDDGTGFDKKSDLDLESLSIDTDIALTNCLFFSKVTLQRGKLKSIFLNGSRFLEDLSLNGADISGDLKLAKIQSNKEILLIGCMISGDLNCTGMALRPGNGRDALSADRAIVKGVLHFCDGTTINGNVSFAGAEVFLLEDDPMCWPSTPNSLFLEGFKFERFMGPSAEVNAKVRIEWLSKLNHTVGFKPQPYEHLAGIYRRDGQKSFARAILIEKEKLQRRAHHHYLRKKGDRVMAARKRVRDVFFEYTLAFGYRPSLTLRWLFGIWLAGWLVFSDVEEIGAFKPNDSEVWLSGQWKNAEHEAPSQLAYFLLNGGESYPTFNAAIYAVDTLVPVVDLNMQNMWIPDGSKAPWARVYLWLHIALGWFFSLLAVAGFSGLIKPD